MKYKIIIRRVEGKYIYLDMKCGAKESCGYAFLIMDFCIRNSDLKSGRYDFLFNLE